MAEQLLPCPHCQGTDLRIVPREWYNGFGMVATCRNEACLARIWGHDEDDVIDRWNRRAPGPGTKAMLESAKTITAKAREMDQGQGFKPDVLEMVLELEAFIAEWPDPATPPAPAPSPWRCRICGEPVRLGDDLTVTHLDPGGHAHYGHDAELTDAGLKQLNDGLGSST